MGATIAARLERLDWPTLEAGLWERGWAKTPPFLTSSECSSLIRLYAHEARFRSRVDMERHRFGVGDYKYLARPLPPLVEQLRVHAYPPLAAVANRWTEALGLAESFPLNLAAFLARCAEARQTKPTPLLLHYEAGGYNCLHQDVYGAVGFPLQLVAFLSRPGRDYSGGSSSSWSSDPGRSLLGRRSWGKRASSSSSPTACARHGVPEAFTGSACATA
jgi:uncharacterized protein